MRGLNLPEALATFALYAMCIVALIARLIALGKRQRFRRRLPNPLQDSGDQGADLNTPSAGRDR